MSDRWARVNNESDLEVVSTNVESKGDLLRAKSWRLRPTGTRSGGPHKVLERRWCMRAPGQASGLRLGKGAEPAICDPERSPAWAAFDCYFGPTPFTSQGCT